MTSIAGSGHAVPTAPGFFGEALTEAESDDTADELAALTARIRRPQPPATASVPTTPPWHGGAGGDGRLGGSCYCVVLANERLGPCRRPGNDERRYGHRTQSSLRESAAEGSSPSRAASAPPHRAFRGPPGSNRAVHA